METEFILELLQNITLVIMGMALMKGSRLVYFIIIALLACSCAVEIIIGSYGLAIVDIIVIGLMSLTMYLNKLSEKYEYLTFQLELHKKKEDTEEGP